MKKEIGLTARTLSSVLTWADFCRRNKNFKWTKWDDNRYAMVQKEIKNILNNQYENTKTSVSGKINIAETIRGIFNF